MTFKAVSQCVADVSPWFLENGLLLNITKNEAVLFCTRTQHEKISTASGLDVTGAIVPFHYTVKLLGVTLDSGLTMDRHVTGVLRSYSYHTHTLWHICLLLPLDSAKMIVHSIVSWLDYANALLHGMFGSSLDKLQVAQNSLAGVVCQALHSASDRVTEAASLVTNLSTDNI